MKKPDPSAHTLTIPRRALRLVLQIFDETGRSTSEDTWEETEKRMHAFGALRGDEKYPPTTPIDKVSGECSRKLSTAQARTLLDVLGKARPDVSFGFMEQVLDVCKQLRVFCGEVEGDKAG